LLEPEFEVVLATSAARALELIPQVRPDVILLDVIMPDMDGYELCVRLKADLATTGIPIIFITGLQGCESESHGLELGAADYVTKPFSPNVVRARVRNHVELKQARDRLLALAATDGMTGLFNRRAFDVALDREYKRLARIHAPVSLMLLDVDHFKAFNDRYGHVAGDDCLRDIADVILGAMNRPADLAARYGGEEFVCILPETDSEGAIGVAERIQSGIRELAIPHLASSTASTVTASIGLVTEVCRQQSSGERLIAVADECLYRAKADGRNRIVARVETAG
jgi:diguanylate cyclase (GGDEF)-like protein